MNLFERIEKQINDLSEFTSTPGEGTTRLTYSQEDLLARNYIKNKMKKYGLVVTRRWIGKYFWQA